MDVTDPDSPRAELVVSFVAAPAAAVAVTPSGEYHLEKLAARTDLPCKLALQKAVEPLSIIGHEHEFPPHLANVRSNVRAYVYSNSKLKRMDLCLLT